jgi:cob(I)alamin adenosyltransferase
MPRIYTKTGDDGTTGLLYGGRVSKDDLVTEAYGTTDEAVAVLGLARSLTNEPALPEVFIVPGATPSSAALDMARSTIRRAERGVVALERDRPTNPEVRRYLNRLSDLLFVLARWEAGESEPASR